MNDKRDRMAQALAQARTRSHAQAEQQRTAAPRGPDTMHRDTWGEIAASIPPAIGTGLRNVAESTVGLPADLSFDTGLGFRLPLSANILPNSEQVAAGTDAMQKKLPESWQQPINDYSRAEATNPFAEATQTATEWIADPTNLIGAGELGKFGKVGKLLDRGDLAEHLARLPGSPAGVEGPVPHVVQTAEEYAKGRGIDLPGQRQKEYAPLNEGRGARIAAAYERMPHAPQDPKVKAAYEALANETMQQWHAMIDSGTKIDFMPAGQPDPYPGGPKDALADLRQNNHLWVFPTEQGYGSGVSDIDIANNPLLANTGIEHNGHKMLVNDAFRAIHDYFGHGMEGAHFGPRGEENAWLAHKRLFSPEALSAATSELRGQNSWVNFGPFGEANRANPRATTYADQKTGLMPDWTTKDAGKPLSQQITPYALPPALAAALMLGGSRGQR
jgi:hypothetical protein